jgi:hypothetical protein
MKTKVKAINLDVMDGNTSPVEDDKQEEIEDINNEQQESIEDCKDDPVVEDVVNHDINKEEEIVKKKKPELELVECPTCNKTMTKKNLKYKHSKICHVKKKEEVKVEEPKVEQKQMHPHEVYYNAVKEYRQKMIEMTKEKNGKLVKNMFGNRYN